MSENTANESVLTEQNAGLAKDRAAFGEKLKDGADRTLLDIMSEPVDIIIRGITRGSKTLSFEVSIAILEILILGLGFGISAIVREVPEFRIRLLEISNVVISFSFVVLVKSYFDKLKEGFHSDFLEFVNSRNSLDEIKSWFDRTTRKTPPLLWGMGFSIVFSVGLAFFGRFVIYQFNGGFLGWGPLVLLVLANIPIGMGGYYLLISRDFRVQAKSWDFRIYEQNPSQSIAIQKFSRLLSAPVTIIALLAALTTLAFSVTRSLSLPTLVIAVICGWYPMLSIFVRNHVALAAIITRAKQKKLSELQNKISEFEREGLKSVDGIQYLQKLIDYQDRIASTPNTALNFRITFGFINTLLLPLVTLFLSNLDTILELFS